MNNRLKVPSFLKELFCLLVGEFIYSVGVHVFTSPNNIAPGGVTGIATLLNYLFDWHIGIVTLCINIPLLILSIFFLGKRFTFRTLSAVMLFTVFMDYVVVYIPEYHGDTFLASLFGGVLMGVGLGLIFMGDFTSGGTDIIVRLIQKKYPHFSTGKLIMLFDVAIITISVFVYDKDINVALYAFIAIYACSIMIDTIIYGADIGRMVMIVSDKSGEISSVLLEKLDRGVTLLDAKGGYTGKEKQVIMIAVKRNQFYKVKKMVYSIDPAAFMIVTEAGEIVGEGFKSPNAKQK